MFQTYLKIALRNLWRKPVYFFINVGGLAVGIACFFLISLYVHFELSYDGFNTKADRIYRVVGDVNSSTGSLHWHETPGPMAPALKAEFPEVQEAVRVVPANVLVRKGALKFQEEHSLWADPGFFTVFDFPLEYGDPKTALLEPNSIVFSETAAYKYFGHSNPVGQTLLFSGLSIPVKVTGVMKDIPGNSHIQADMLISMATYSRSFVPWVETDWDVFDPSTYVLLSPGADVGKVQSKLPAFIQKHGGTALARTNTQYTAKLEPLKDVYLRSTYGAMQTGSLTNITIFIIVALFILLIACVNFVNLTTARSVERAKEVGIRKCAGAGKRQLLGQFLIESMVVTTVAYFGALILSSLLLPLFNGLAGKTISTGIFENVVYPLVLLGLALVIGLLAGIYPAMVLSNFRPVTVLKGRYSTGAKGVLLRKVLVVTQFTISIALIVGTLVVYVQLNFMEHQSLGFNKDQLLVISNNGDPGAIAFKKEIADLPSVQSASISSAVPGRSYSDNGNDMGWVRIENSKHEMARVNINFYNVDRDFLKVFQIKMLAGKIFEGDSSTGVLLNKTAVAQLGYSSSQEAIGRRFTQDGFNGTIIGVVDDFHYHSLKEAVQPLCLLTGRGYWQYTSLKVTGGNLPATIKALRDKWEKTIPNRPFNYFFLDEDFDSHYRAEVQFGRLFTCFSTLAILISCLGLLGIASYNTLQRTREIGIRKTLGASVPQMIGLLSKDFVQLVVLAFLIAGPISWLAMNQWLDGFASRITISWWIFLLAGGGALFIALFTISFQAVRAAVANPVDSLRME